MFDDKINQGKDFASFLRDLENAAKSHRSGTLNILVSNRELANDELNKVV